MRNQPAKPIVDLIRRLGLKLGSIENLYGNVFDAVSDSASALGTLWYYVQASGSIPREVLVDAAIQDKTFSVVDSVAGVTNLNTSGIRADGNSLLLYTGVTPPKSQGTGSITVPISIEASGADIGLYVNDVSVLKGNGSINTSIVLSSNKNVIQIVLQRYDPANVVIRVPSDLPIGGLPLAPGIPVWDTTALIFGFFGTTQLSASLQLRWKDSSFAGAWKIERTSYRLLGTITNVAYDSGAEEYTITVNGLHGTISNNIDALVDKEDLLGPIISVTEGGSTTDFVISSTVAQGTWTDTNFFVSDTQSIISTVEREDVLLPSQGIFVFNDTGIKESIPYSYRLAAIHPLHADLESAWSDKETIFALDNTPPGDVIIVGTPEVAGEEVTVNYTAPSDADYQGVRVFLFDTGVYTPIMNDFGRPGDADQLSFFAPQDGDYWLRTFDYARNIQPEGSGVMFSVTLGTGGGGIDPTPNIQFRVLPVSGWDPAFRTDVEISATVEGARVITALEYFIGALPTSPAWSAAPTNPYVISFTRTSTDYDPRILNVKATADDGTIGYDIMVVDWDREPRVGTYAVHPRYQSQIQIGWSIVGVGDDDMNSVQAQVISGQATIITPVIVDTDSIKDFQFDIDQAPGEKAEIHLTPYDDVAGSGTAGKKVKFVVYRNPISYYILRENSLTEIEITLVSIP